MTSAAFHPTFTPRSKPASRGPGGSELLDEGLALATMPVIGLAVCPGFLLCVPGLILAIAPAVALGLVALAVALVMAVLAAPVLVGRHVARRLRPVLARGADQGRHGREVRRGRAAFSPRHSPTTEERTA